MPMTCGGIVNLVTAVVFLLGGPCTVSAISQSEIWTESDEALSLLQSRTRKSNHATQDPHAGVTRGSTARGTPYTIQTFVYGKYFADCTKRDASRLDQLALEEELCQDDGASRDSKPNTVHVWIPDGGEEASRPLVVHTHGGAFVSGPAWSDPEAVEVDVFVVDSLLDSGVAFASAAYRFVTTTYQYEDSAGVVRDEEFVSVAEDGMLTLDEERELTDYEPLISWQELMPKCAYDASRALDYLLVNAASLRIDTNRVGFYGDSAGTALAAYLSLVYPALPGHPYYRAVSLTLRSVQIEYPFLPLLSSGWALLADELGDDAPLSTLISKEKCPVIFGNKDGSEEDHYACPRSNICNQTWPEEAAAMFCGDSYGATTFGRLRQTLTWPMDSPQHRGLAKLWDIPANFKALRREGEGPLEVWIRTVGRGDDGSNAIIHHPLWAKAYAKVFDALPRDIVQYAVYYGDAPGMLEQKIQQGGLDHYQESFDWTSRVGRHPGVPRASGVEMAMMHCNAMGVRFAW